MKSWLQDNEIEMHLTHNPGKSVVVEWFIKMLKDKVYKYMTSMSKNMYVDKLVHIVNEYNNTYHTTIKMNSADVKPSICIHFDIENSDKDPNLKLDTM